MARVVVENLVKIFKGAKGGSICAVDNLSVTVEDKEFLVLVGPSGCGKTTTLRLIAGLEKPTQGTILIDGQAMNGVTPKDRDIAMVFQQHALYPHMTVFENMAFGLRVRKHSKADLERSVGEAAELLNLRDCLQRKPEELSGGQRQRVAVGRAIVRKPKVFLFDEPLSNLDAPLRAQMRRELARLHARLAVTMIYVTHDQVEAMTMGDRIAVLKEGALQQVANPASLYQRPANQFVAGFIGSPTMNFFQGSLLQQSGKTLFQGAAGPDGALNGFNLLIDEPMASRVRQRAPGQIVLALRPEHIVCKLSSEGVAPEKRLEANAEVFEFSGAEAYLYCTSGTHSMVARVPVDCPVKTPQKVSLVFDMSAAHFFDPATGKAVSA